MTTHTGAAAMTTQTSTYYALETMRTIRFGIELEYVGITRERAAQAIQSVIGGTVEHIGSPYVYDPFKIHGANGQDWTIVRDGSVSDSRGNSCEVVSPPLGYDDISVLQDIVRALRRAGARTNEKCGCHIHLDGGRFSIPEIVRLCKLTYQQEELISEALEQVKARQRPSGLDGRCWCHPIPADFVRELDNVRTESQLKQAWYRTNGGYSESNHYDNSRYHGLNLHSYFYRRNLGQSGTVEFRWFASTTHAGKVKSWIQFVLALGAKALNARAASARRRVFNAAHTKYAFRVFTIRLGLNGSEFKTLRHHTLGQLRGSSSWANGSQAASTRRRNGRNTEQPEA